MAQEKRYMIVKEATDEVVLTADDLDTLARAAKMSPRAKALEILQRAKDKGRKGFKMEEA